MNITELKQIAAKAKEGWYDKTREDFNAHELSFCGVFGPTRITELLTRIEGLEAELKTAKTSAASYALQNETLELGNKLQHEIICSLEARERKLMKVVVAASFARQMPQAYEGIRRIDMALNELEKSS